MLFIEVGIYRKFLISNAIKDVKPTNILVNSHGDVKLCDVSLPKFSDSYTYLQTVWC